MRSFSKKLAFVLAAAMVVTAFAPAAKAEAAKEMAINKSSQILYVNEGINHKGGEVAAPGKGNVSVYDFSVKNKPADWKTAYTFAWSTKDDDVVSVAKGGVVTAVGVGKATVYCKVTEKATGEVTTLKTKVTVKANAYDVEITNADKWDGATVEVNDVVDLNRAMYDEDGNKTTKRGTLVTDYTKWVAEPAAGVEIDQTTGKFTFTEAAVAGEYKLSCYTYQSSKYTEKTAESDVVVVEFVKDKAFEVVQNSTKKLTLTLSSKVDALNVADVAVNKMIGDYSYPQDIKSVTVDENGTTVTVVVFNNLEDKAEYAVKVKDFKDAAFTASVGTPVRMEIIAVGKNPAYVATTNVTETLKCVFYDANDVDVTEAKNYEASVTYKLEKNATQGEFVLNNNKLTIKKNTATPVVIANYRGVFEGGKVVGALTAQQKFIAVDAPAIYPTGVQTFDLDRDWYNAQQTSLQLKETKPLWIKLNLSNNKDVAYTTLSGVENAAFFTINNATSTTERITITAITPDVADIVNGVVIPHKAGTAVFYVNYGMKVNNQWNDVPFDTIEITVLADEFINSVAVNETAFTISTSDIVKFNNTEMTMLDFIANYKKCYTCNEVVLKTATACSEGHTETFDTGSSAYANVDGLMRVQYSLKSFNLLVYDQRGNRCDFVTGAPTAVTFKCLSDGFGNGFDPQAISSWPYVNSYFNGQGYWADGKQNIGLQLDGALIKNYLVSKGLFDTAENGQYITLDYEVTYKNVNGTDLKSYFTVTIQEPTEGADNQYLEVKTSSGYVDIARYATPNNPYDNAEAQKTVSFDIIKKSNGVDIDTVQIAKYNESVATVGSYQYKVFKDGNDITNSANVTLGKSDSYPFVQAQDLVKQNKVTVRLSGTKGDACLDKAIAATGSAIPNYYDGGAGAYTFVLYEWFVDGSGNKYSVPVLTSDVTVVLGDTGAYSIDHNSQRFNTVAINSTGGLGGYDAADALKILKCFQIANRDGKAVTKTDDGVNYYVDGTYNYYVNYSAPVGANYVYVKEIVFYEDLGGDVYAPYTVAVDVTLQK